MTMQLHSMVQLRATRGRRHRRGQKGNTECGIASLHRAGPSHIFKLVYDSSTGRAWAHWQANSQDTRMSAPISYEEFTRRTGMPLLAGVMRGRG
ncbi:hypothetical protein ATN89_08630 [Comamonas thiooxydans]|nr:hypothetical protein ATN89_08630 [Comamonas thiooxydans]